MPVDAHLVVFEIASQRYALPLSDVDELARMVTVVPLPKAPAIVEGIINAHGAIVPVLDIRSRFRLPPKPIDPADHLVLARAGRRRVAIRVDRVIALERVGVQDIERPSESLSGTEYVAGVAKLEDGLVLIHDLETFLNRTESQALEAALDPGGP